MKEQSNQNRIPYPERKQQILETAKKLMQEKDLTAVTMSDISRACGISRQRLYQYFNSIDAIIFAIQDQIIRRLHFKPQPTIESGVLELIDGLYGFYKANPDDFIFICQFDMYVHLHAVPEALLRQYREMIEKMSPRLMELLTDKLRAKMDDEIVTQHLFPVIIHMVFGFISRVAVLSETFEQGLVKEDESIRWLKNILLNYLKSNGIA